MKYNFVPLLISFVLLITIINTSCTQGAAAKSKTSSEQIELKLNLPIGTKQNIISTISSVGASVTLKNISEHMYEVVDNANDAISFKINVLREKGEIGMSGEIDKYDSEIDESEMDDYAKSIHQDYKPRLENELKVIVDVKGNVLKDVTLFNGENFDGSAFELTNIILVLPKEKVSIGDTWKEEKSNSLGALKSTTSFTYTIKDITEKTVEIHAEGVASLMGSKVSGTIIVDRSTGALVKADLESKLTMGGKMITTYEVK